MQIIGSVQIVTVVTSVAPTFFSCIALFVFATFALLLFVLLYSLECAWGVSLLRERFSGAARPPKNPLASWAQLDQLMGALLLLFGQCYCVFHFSCCFFYIWLCHNC